MPVKKGTKKAERPYDAKRKENTLKELKKGLEQLKRQKKHQEGKPVTRYALTKHTGVADSTIKKYQEILDALENQNKPKVNLEVFKKVSKIDPKGIKNLPQAIYIIEELVAMYNKVVDKHDEGVKQNSALNLEIVKLKDDTFDLRRKIAQKEKSK